MHPDQTPPPRILVVNGSLGGARGNTGALLDSLLAEVRAGALADQAPTLDILALADGFDPHELPPRLEAADAFVFATGVYWDSWGSPLQRFLEEVTATEAGDAWLGKPAAVLVTEHSVGGKSVLSRLQGVLGTLGCLIPPMSGMVYSMANHLALRGERSEFHDDLWQRGDFRVIARNLLAAWAFSGQGEPRWRAWPVDSQDARRRWV